MDLIPKSLKMKKRPAFEPIPKDFNINWNNVLRDAERNLVELLLNESLKVVERVELDLDLGLKRFFPKNYENKRFQLNQKQKKFQKNLDKRCLKKWNNIKQKEILSERISVDCNTTKKFDIERKEVQEHSKCVGKNLQNVTDNRQYRKKQNKLYSDVAKSVDSSTEEAPECGKTIIDLKNIQFILLRDENLKSSKIQSSPPGICTDSSSLGNASSNVLLKVESETFSRQGEELLEILEELQKPIQRTGFFLILKLNYLKKVWILRLFSEELMSLS